MNELEKFLASYFNKKYCCFTGSGTTAVYLILKALNLKGKKILFPAITCMAPVNAAMYAGYDIVFCDINLNDYTIDINNLEALLNKHEIGIIVPTHIYGHRCNMDKISEIATKNNIFILEDAAQTDVLSEKSDASITSFGHTKIFKAENGGGAVCTEDQGLFDSILHEKQKLNNKKENTNELFNNYREIYYSIIKAIKKDGIFWELMLYLQKVSKDVFVYNLDANLKIIEVLKRCNKIVENRIKRADLYDKYLDKASIEIPMISRENVRWRYSFLFHGDRDKLLEKVRERDIDISSWYPSLHRMYSNQKDIEFPNAIFLEKHIVNLWVDPKYSEEKIRNDIENINDILRLIKSNGG
jgi:dTDP-4-amino-4,6-dideoxygalactose transaminase